MSETLDFEAIKQRARWCEDDRYWPKPAYSEVARRDSSSASFYRSHAVETDALMDRHDLIAEVEQLRSAPEWRPLSVLTPEAVIRASHWVVRNEGFMCMHTFESIEDFHATIGDFMTGDECRPVDSEGIPVPWAKVGL